MSVRLAFSGGVESTYLAQMFLEEGNSVELHYGNVRGVLAEPEEAGMVYRCFLKLKELYGDKVKFFYCPQKYFTSAQANNVDQIHYVNQAFRVACLLTDMMAFGGNFVYACGWTGSGALEKSLNPGCYTERDYQEMKQLPRLLQKFSRAYSFPHVILTPLYNQKKTDIYNKLNPELRDYLVLNSNHEYISRAKLDEYKKTGLPLPQYLDGEINPSVPKAVWDNQFARFFYDVHHWMDYFGDTSNLLRDLLQDSRPFNPHYKARMDERDVLLAVSSFETRTRKLIELIHLGNGAKQNAESN
jgi:hypothetical protein